MAGCPGAPTIRLQVGQHACVADLEGQLLRLRSKPLIQQGNVIRRIHSGVQLKILDGPVCANRYTWWQVETGNGLTGWVAEGSQQGYFLEQCR